MIISPLILSSIYEYNIEAVYYFSSAFPAIACIIMIYISTWKNARELGKSSQVNDQKEAKQEVELKSVAVTDEKKSEGTGENENVDITTYGKVNAVEINIPNDLTTSTDNPSS